MNLPNSSQSPQTTKRPIGSFLVAVAVCAAVAFGVTYVLVTMFQRKIEAKNPWVRMVEVDENTSDPAKWGVNWRFEYDGYLRTVDNTRTRYGGSEALPDQKAKAFPWLTRMFAGYAFSIDYRDRRGHAFMLSDQETTERIAQKPQPAACLHCHASITPTWRRLGAEALGKPFSSTDFDWPAVMKGFELVSAMSYIAGHAELLKTPDGTPETSRAAEATAPGSTTRAALAGQVGDAHPVSCVDCHNPNSMELRVTRPGFVLGIQALARSDAGVPHLPSVQRWREGDRARPYDPNVDATRQEMRSFVCGQCHVEYYCGPRTTLFFPWDNGLKVEQIEKTYDAYKFSNGERFYDWKHAETGAEVLKAQHPEFELWSQGIHARSGVACADCHMPYKREGAAKVSDHWVRSPLLADNINRACQTCHRFPESELLARAQAIQDRTHNLLQRSGLALTDMLDAIKSAKQSGATAQQLSPILEMQRQSQWRQDFIAAENSMGFHAPQEAARILAESIDLSRQAQMAAKLISTTRPAQ